MKRKSFLAALFVFAVFVLPAQPQKPVYSGAVAVGLVGGESGPAGQLQAVNGLRYKTWSAGIGAGLDYYHSRSVPLFLSLSKAFTPKAKTAFAYLDGGYNLPWLKSEDENLFVTDKKGGLYAAGGLGFVVPVWGTRGFFLSAGYGVKRLTKTVNIMPWISVWPPPKEAFRDYVYTLGCLSLKAGLRF